METRAHGPIKIDIDKISREPRSQKQRREKINISRNVLFVSRSPLRLCVCE